MTKPIDGDPATPANGGTVGFAMDGAEQADAWHKVEWRMAVLPSRTRRVCGKARLVACTWRTFAIRMATGCARCTGWRTNFLIGAESTVTASD